jgi:hypothetical protein
MIKQVRFVTMNKRYQREQLPTFFPGKEDIYAENWRKKAA